MFESRVFLHALDQGVVKGRAKGVPGPNARIFRETKSRDRKFPDRTFQDRKILGPENSRNSIFSRNSRNIFLRKFQDFFLPEQKIPGLLTLLNSRTKNSVTEFSRTFFYIPEPFQGPIKHESPGHSQISWIVRAYEVRGSWIFGAYEARIFGTFITNLLDIHNSQHMKLKSLRYWGPIKLKSH